MAEMSKTEKLIKLKKLKRLRDLKAKKEGGLNSYLERTRALGEGIGENFPLPHTGKAVRAVSKAVTNAFGIKNPYEEEKARLAEKYPMVYAVGESAPGIARSIATFPVASNLAAVKAAKYIPQAAKGAGAVTRAALGTARIGAKSAGDAAANVVAGQVADPGLDRIGTDAAIGAVLGAGSGIAREAAPLLKKSASKLYSSVLKRPRNKILAEASRGRTLEENLADRAMFTPTVGSLRRTADRNSAKLSKKIKEIIEPIKLRVNPGKMIDELESAKVDLGLVDDVGRVTPGETTNVKVLDDMIEHIDRTYLRDAAGKRVPHLSVKEAQKLKQTLWSRARKVFEQTDTSAMNREAQAAAGRGMRKGIEEAAEGTKTGWGKELAKTNREQGVWLEAGNAADAANARIGKTIMGRMIMPLMFSGGAAASHYGGAEGGTAPLAAAALLSTPTGRLLSGNILSALGRYAPQMSLASPVLSNILNDRKK